MALANLLNLSSESKKVGLSEERIQAVLPIVKLYIALWREYPDIFIDFLLDGGNPERKKTIDFYYYLRAFLRAAMRYKYAYFVFPRA